MEINGLSKCYQKTEKELSNSELVALGREMTRKCYIGDKETPAKFYGVFQVAKVVGESPLIGGHSAGQIMEPVAVVEYNGQLHKAYLDQVHFEDAEVG